jgi:hypothetical protein
MWISTYNSCNSYSQTFGTTLQQKNLQQETTIIIITSVYDSWEFLAKVNSSTEKEWDRRYSFNARLNIFILWLRFLKLVGRLLNSIIPE